MLIITPKYIYGGAHRSKYQNWLETIGEGKIINLNEVEEALIAGYASYLTYSAFIINRMRSILAT